MKSLICAAVLLVTPSIAAACNPVLQLNSGAYVAPQAAPVVYAPVVQAIEVGYAAPVVQEIRIRQQVRVRHQKVRATPVRNLLFGRGC